MPPHECNQVERLERIEEDIHNHRAWRNSTSTQLTNIEVMLATINERLKQFDKSIEVSRGFKTAIISVCATLFFSIMTGVYAYGTLAQQVKVNTDRWDRLLKSEADSLAHIQGTVVGNVK